jgi:hypothetical protein
VPVILVIAAAESALEIKLAKKACQPNQELSFAAGRKIFPIARANTHMQRRETSGGYVAAPLTNGSAKDCVADFNFAASVL